ncbi:MAG: hypothetical protein HY660_09795 [Armatimonadetes bacterium]|nr:hypothetical protein [Armatimonadota bacterium]
MRHRVLVHRVTAVTAAVTMLALLAGLSLAAPADQPRPGGVINITMTSDPVMNPVIALGVSSYWTSAIIFDALTKPDATGKPLPNLAERWDVSPDGKTYTFYLRKDVKWHDGKPFTAEDVKFTIDLIKDPKTNTTLRGNYGPVQRVEVVDPHTVRFHLARPYVTLLSWLYWYAGIVPKHALQGKDVNTNADFNKRNPVGTGPFKLREYKPAEYVMLERYEGYHGGRPLADRVVIKIIPDPNTAVAQMKAGGLDFITLPALALRTIQGDPNLNLLFFDLPRYDFIAPNQNLKMFQDKKVRQALAYGLNRRALLEVGVLNYGVMAASPIGPALGEFYNTRVRPFPLDPSKAKALLREAGWADTNGDGVVEKDLGDGRGRTPLRFKLTTFKTADHLAMGAIAKDNWQGIGVDAILEPLEHGQVQTARVIPRAYEALLNSWITVPDPDLFNYFHSSVAMAGANYGVWRNEEADRLLEAGQAESDPARRRQIYWKFQELAQDEQPVIFTYHPKEINATSKRLQGVLPSHFRINIYWLHKWWIRQ